MVVRLFAQLVNLCTVDLLTVVMLIAMTHTQIVTSLICPCHFLMASYTCLWLLAKDNCHQNVPHVLHLFIGVDVASFETQLLSSCHSSHFLVVAILFHSQVPFTYIYKHFSLQLMLFYSSSSFHSIPIDSYCLWSLWNLLTCRAVSTWSTYNQPPDNPTVNLPSTHWLHLVLQVSMLAE